VGAAITDWLDGVIARRHKLISNFGKLMDPLADKLIVASAFIVFVELHLFPGWVVVLILCREFIITGLRQLGMAQGRVIHADKWGKSKTISQMVTIVATLVFLCARDTLIYTGHWEAVVVRSWSLDLWLHGFLLVLLMFVVFFTVWSGAIYVLKNRDLFTSEF